MRRLGTALLLMATGSGMPAWSQWSAVLSDAKENTASGTDALLHLNSTASGNTAAGYRALYADVSGSNNSALGAQALLNLVSGSDNSAVGYDALAGASSGTGHGTFSKNTAAGSEALAGILTGQSNTAIGVQSLYADTTGSHNTAVGSTTLSSTVTENSNTAAGYNTLSALASGDDNVAVGAMALQWSEAASSNAAFGYLTMGFDGNGSDNALCGAQDLMNSNLAGKNAAIGFAVGLNLTSGNANVGAGYKALYSITTASNNIGVGSNAGFNVMGSNNIDVGSYGVSADSGVIRFGSTGSLVASGPSISATYVAGVTTTQLTGSALFVSSTGQLGTLASAQRYKVGIHSLDTQASRLDQLRPITFHLKNDPTGALQYGLIAEEVETVYPELVTRSATGQADGVRYDELTPLLLTEMKELSDTHRRLRDELERAQRENIQLQAQLKRNL